MTNMPKVRDLVSPIGPTLWETQSLSEAARKIAAEGEAVVVLNLSARPVGMITEADLKLLAYREPDDWKKMRCTSLVSDLKMWVQIQDSLEDILACYQQEQIRPLLVLDGSETVGIVYPSTVFQWSAKYHPAILEKLSQQARDLPHCPRRRQHAGSTA